MATIPDKVYVSPSHSDVEVVQLRARVAELGKKLITEQAERFRLQEVITAWQASAMINDSSGDPGTITPEHNEKQITNFRGRVAELEGENNRLRMRLEEASFKNAWRAETDRVNAEATAALAAKGGQ